MYASGYNIICIAVPLVLAWIAKFEVFDWGELVNFVRKCNVWHISPCVRALHPHG